MNFIEQITENIFTLDSSNIYFSKQKHFSHSDNKISNLVIPVFLCGTSRTLIGAFHVWVLLPHEW